jgi:excisionase family DNA binding protein
MRELMDKKELVEYCSGKLRPDTIGRLTREGKIPFVKFPGIRRYFYDKAAIDKWLEGLQQGTAGQSAEPSQYGKLRKVSEQ